jgi:hypothetical protein
MKPIRIQKKRTKGWRMPSNTVYVGRPTLFGNLHIYGSKNDVVELYKRDILDDKAFMDYIKSQLKGKNLACWCPLNQPCHADILLKIANEVVSL